MTFKIESKPFNPKSQELWELKGRPVVEFDFSGLKVLSSTM